MRVCKMRFCLMGMLIALVLGPIGYVDTAYADGPHRVGLVVDFGDGRVETACVTFEEAEITGMDVLLRAGYEVVTGFGGGAVCQINGQGCPSSNCLGCQPTGDGGWIYWAYFHLEDGCWVYSQVGAVAYYVDDGDVEGWAWGTGQTDPPPVITFDEICASPTNTPTATATPAFTATPTLPRPTATSTSTPTPVPTPTPIPTLTPIPQMPTSTPTPVSEPTNTATPMPEGPTETPTNTPTSTSMPTPRRAQDTATAMPTPQEPTATLARIATSLPESTSTLAPQRPTETPTETPTSSPTAMASAASPEPKTMEAVATPSATPSRHLPATAATAVPTATSTPSAIAEVQTEDAGRNPATASIKLVERPSTPGEAGQLFRYFVFSIMVIGLLAAIILLRMR